MASFSNFISFLFFTTLLFISLHHINARDSQFFSKVTSYRYDLDGHESGMYPPSTTASAATNQPRQYKIESDDTNKYYNYKKYEGFRTKQNKMSDTNLAASSYNNDDKNAYGEKQNTKFTEEGYNSMENQNNNIDNGQYFYDFNSESENYKPDLYGGSASKGVNSENNWSNSREYFGSNNNVNNNANSYKSQNVFENDQVNFDP